MARTHSPGALARRARTRAANNATIYAGAGDGKLKKIQGVDLEWEEISETSLAGHVTSVSMTVEIAESHTAEVRTVRLPCISARVRKVSTLKCATGARDSQVNLIRQFSGGANVTRSK